MNLESSGTNIFRKPTHLKIKIKTDMRDLHDAARYNNLNACHEFIKQGGRCQCHGWQALHFDVLRLLKDSLKLD